MTSELIGYADQFSVAPGDRIRFMVSTDLPAYEATIVRLRHADQNPAGPGFKEDEIDTPVKRECPGRKQSAYAGSYVLVADDAVLRQTGSLTLQAWVYPTTPQNSAPQGLLTKWSQPDGVGYGLYVGEDGDLGLWLGDENGPVEHVHTGRAMRAGQWYFVAACYDADAKEVRLYQTPLSAWPADPSSAFTQRAVQTQGPGSNAAPLLIAAGFAEAVAAERLVGRALFNGKIVSPRMFARALSAGEIEQLRQDVSPQEIGGDDLIAAWDFTADISAASVIDTGTHQLRGEAINMPARAMTGHNWSGDEFDVKLTAYAAC